MKILKEKKSRRIGIRAKWFKAVLDNDKLHSVLLAVNFRCARPEFQIDNILLTFYFFIFTDIIKWKKYGVTMAENIDRIKKRGKLLIGVAGDVPGKSYWDPKTNRVEGFEADLGRLVAKELLGSEDRAEYVKVLGNDRVNSLKERRVDLVISLFTITKERAAQVDFSDPYFIDKESLLVLKDGPIKQLSDLNGKKVAVVEKSATLLSLQEDFPEGEIVEVKSKTDGIKAINEHQVEALANTTVNLSLMWQSLPDKDRYTLIGTGDRFPPKEYAVGVKKNCPDLLEFVNKALSKFKNQGILNELQKKHGWIQSQRLKKSA